MTDLAPKRRWFSWSLRTMFAVVAITCVLTYSLLGQKRIVDLIESQGGHVYYDYEENYDGSFGVFLGQARLPPGPAWLWKLVDRNLYFDIVGVTVGSEGTDDTLYRIGRLQRVQFIDVEGAREVTETGIQYLNELPKLNRLSLNGTSVSEQAADRFMQAHPGLVVFWSASYLDPNQD